MSASPLTPDPASGRRAPRWVWPVVIIGILAVIAVAATWDQEWLGGEPDAGTPPPAAADFTEEERTFYAYVGPRLRDLAAEAQAAEELGRNKSRNLLAFQRHGRRIDDLGDEIDDYLEEHPTPARFASAMALYERGIAATRHAMDHAQSGFLTLNWDRVATAIPIMGNGARDLADALAMLESEAGEPELATPTGTPSS